MQQVIFKRTSALVNGQYLIGHYTWPHSMRVAWAKATFNAPEADTTVSLLVDGVDSGHCIQLAPGTKTGSMDLSSGIYVASGVEVRLQVSDGPTDGALAATNATVILAVEAQEESASALPADAFKVKYVNGSESVSIYDYDPALAIFTETSYGITNNRATIDVNGNSNLSVTVSGVGEIFAVTQSGVTQSACFIDAPGALLSESYPRLLWQINGKSVATMSQEGVKAASIDEESVSLDTGKFCLFGGGAVMATIGAGGLSCQSGVVET